MSDIKYQQKVIDAKESIAQIMKYARVQYEDREQFINECSELAEFIDELANGVQESTNQALPIQSVRFQLPSDKQIVEIAILFNDGKIDEETLTKMVSMSNFIIDRLYENGDVSKPSRKEGN